MLSRWCRKVVVKIGRPICSWLHLEKLFCLLLLKYDVPAYYFGSHTGPTVARTTQGFGFTEWNGVALMNMFGNSWSLMIISYFNPVGHGHPILAFLLK
mmetsp:Transcript_10633/g.16965  ORF Transcript_10633/g.16965 Transcript_10633/m.16965 type:complete len:98 (+) Transcript_10633:419-712(+)